MKSIRILFLSDTHLGIDWPRKPRVKRPRRGDDFWKNYLLALQPAFNDEVDLVVHGGDLLYRSKVPDWLINKAFSPLIEIAEKAVPVYVVPGNHERSHFKRGLFEWHPNLYIFDRPRNFLFRKNGLEVQLAGFPFVRGDIRIRFPEILTATNWKQCKPDFRILCLHHPFDGGEVGIQNFRFWNRPDTIRLTDLPDEFDIVLAGHLHRAQILKTPNQIPVVFNGSTERTSFVERLEKKGYHLITLKANGSLKIDFHELPSRPMFLFRIEKNQDLKRLISILRSLPEQAYVKVIVEDEELGLTTPWLRDQLPESMIIELRKVE